MIQSNANATSQEPSSQFQTESNVEANKIRSWTLPLKVPIIEFFLMFGLRCMCTYIKNLTSKIKIMGLYHSVQMRC